MYPDFISCLTCWYQCLVCYPPTHKIVMNWQHQQKSILTFNKNPASLQRYFLFINDKKLVEQCRFIHSSIWCQSNKLIESRFISDKISVQFNAKKVSDFETNLLQIKQVVILKYRLWFFFIINHIMKDFKDKLQMVWISEKKDTHKYKRLVRNIGQILISLPRNMH